MFLYLAIFLLLLVVYMIQHLHTKLDLSGPRGLPYLGNILQVEKVNGQPNLMWTVINWAKTYGDIFKFKLLGQDIVVVSGYEGIYEVLVKKSTNFAGRPYVYRFDLLVANNDMGFADYNAAFRVNKKVGQQGLKQYGDGMNRIERLAQEEIERFIEDFEKQNKNAFDPRESVMHLTLRIIEGLVVGEHLSKDDSDTKKSLAWLHLARDHIFEGFDGIVLDVFPLARYFGNRAYKALEEFKAIAHPLWTDWAKRCTVKKQQEGTECKTLLETLLEAEEAGTISREATFGILQNAFGAGVFTTYSTSSVFLLLMLNYPEHQEKLYKEITEVLGDRMPTISDKANMPLMEATILEVLRYSTIVPMALPHKTTCDTTVMGHPLPKGTQIWTNLWSMHHDERYFDQPDVFDPTRYLDSHGKVITPDERKSFLPFGAGRRVCAGEVLAKSRLFLMLTRLVQKFEFQPEAPDKMPSCDMKSFNGNLAMLPPAFQLIAKSRRE